MITTRLKAARQLASESSLPRLTRYRAALKALTIRFPGSRSSGFGDSSSSTIGGWQIQNFSKAISTNFAREIGDPLNSSLLMVGIQYAMGALSEPSFLIGANDKEGKFERIDGHPLLERLSAPNPHHSLAELWGLWAFSWLIDGNAYWYQGERDRRSRPMSIWPIPHWCLEPRWSGTDFISYYEYKPGDGSTSRIPVEDVVHFRNGLDPRNTRKGLSPLRAAMMEVYTDLQALAFSAMLLKNLGVPPFAIMPKEFPEMREADATTENMEQPDIDVVGIKQAVMRKLTGKNRGEPLIFDAPFEIKTLGIEPRKMSLDTHHEIPESRVAALLGIPGIMLGFLYGSKYGQARASWGEAREQATEVFLVPTWGRFCATVHRQMLWQYEKPERAAQLILKPDLSTVKALEEDENEKHKRAREDWSAGLITRYDAKTSLGMSADETDKVYLIPGKAQLVKQDGSPLYVAPEPKPMPALDTAPTDPESPTKNLLN